MDDLARLVAEASCLRLVHDYCRLIDLGEAARVHELFTPDGVWEGTDSRMEGHAAIEAGFAPLDRIPAMVMRHHVTNAVVDVVSDDEAVGFAYWVNYRGRRTEDGGAGGAPAVPPTSGPPRFTGEYRDRFVRTTDGWRIAHRHATVTFANPTPRRPD